MNRKQEREAKRAAKAAAATEPIVFTTEAEANSALAETAKVLRMEQHKEATMAKSEKVAGTKSKKVKAERKDGMAALPPLPKAPAKPKPYKDCQCGCGGKTRGNWMPGHDSYFRGWVLRIERDLIKPSDIENPGIRKAVMAEVKRRHEAASAHDGKAKASGE